MPKRSVQEAERCSDCGKHRPIKIVLLSAEGNRYLCEICSNRWLLSDEEWPPRKTQTEIKDTSLTTINNAT